MKNLILLFLLFNSLFLFSQENSLDLLPKKNFRLTFPLLNSSCEFKTGLRTTVTPEAGFGFAYLNGTTYIGGPRFSEFGLIPQFASDFKYYFSLKNRDRKGKINCLFKGSYISLKPTLSLKFLGNPKYIYQSPSYSFQLNLGRQIQKNSNWFFNYYIGYIIFGSKIKTSKNLAEKYSNNFFLNGSIGYSL